MQDKGRVYGWGDSSYGQLGVQNGFVNKVTLLNNIEGKFICKIYSGHYHVIALTRKVCYLHS